MAQCTYHPDRPGVGVCMRCRAVICAACCTRVEGINHCHACLKELANAPRRPRGVAGSLLASLAVLGLAAALFFALMLLAQGRLAP